MAQKLKVIPLGGLDQVGMNMMVIQYGKHLLVIDSGLMFPEDDMLGVDFVLPDFTYIRQNASRLLGIILTHGHEDHIGGLPYLLKEVSAPVYGTKLTLGFAKNKFSGSRLNGVQFKEICSGKRLNIGPFQIEPIGVSHSIPDGVALAIKTPIGTIIHSGDFKFDQAPIDNRITDFGRLSEIGRQGVLLLMSDSTNAEISGLTLPERRVGEVLDDIFHKAKRRIIVASFASHIHRIQQILDAAKRHRKKVLISGRTMLANIEIASSLGYLRLPESLIISNKDLSKLRPSNTVVLCTGSQGEPLSALTRIAMGNHKHISVDPGDSVIISAAPIPGNEKAVSKTINLLLKTGADVFYEPTSNVHASGHACAEELKMMLNLVRPKYFMPIHGEYRHKFHHGKLAQSLWMTKKNVFLLENGDVLELNDKGACRKNGRVPAEMTYVDGSGVGDVEKSVLYDRNILSKDGICIAVIAVKKENGRIVVEPNITLKGVIHERGIDGLVDSAKQCTRLEIDKLVLGDRVNGDLSVIEKCVKSSLSQYLYKEIKRRPVVIPIVLEV